MQTRGSLRLKVSTACLLSWAAVPVFCEETAGAAAARDPNGPVEGCRKGSENEGFFSRLKAHAW